MTVTVFALIPAAGLIGGAVGGVLAVLVPVIVVVILVLRLDLYRNTELHDRNKT